MIEEKFSEKLVSVVVPVYNTSKEYIMETLGSIANQTLDKKDYEIIIVDDCSTKKETIDFVKELSLKKDYKGVDLRIIFHETNKWLAETRITGARASNGKYVVFLDSDDLIREDYLKKAALLLETSLSAGWAYPNIKRFGYFNYITPAQDFKPFDFFFNNFCATASMYRKSTWMKVLQREKFVFGKIRFYEDWDTLFRLAARGWYGLPLKDSEFKYRKHYQSMVVRSVRIHILSLYVMIRLCPWAFFGFLLSKIRHIKYTFNGFGRRFPFDFNYSFDSFLLFILSKALKKYYRRGFITFKMFANALVNKKKFINDFLDLKKSMTLAETSIKMVRKPDFKFKENFLSDFKSTNTKDLSLNKKRKIFFVHPWWGIGGAEIIFLDWMKSIREIKNIKIFDIADIIVGDEKLKEDFKKFSDEQYNLEKISHLPLVKLKFCWNLVQKEMPDIIFIWSNSYFYVLSPLIKKHFPNIKIIDILHNESSPDPVDNGIFELANEYKEYIDKRIVTSDTWKEVLNLKYKEKEEKIKVYENSVDFKKFNPEKYNKILEKKLFKIPEKKFIIGFIGRFQEQKNPHVFLELAKIMEDQPQFYFIMVGEGPDEEDVRKNAKKMNNLKMFGPTLDSSKFISICDVLVLPSNYEGYPLIGMESAAMNVPIIATNIIGFKEQIERGNFGILYNQKDNEKDAKKIKDILLTKMKELQKLGKNGRTFTQKYHDFEKNKIKYRRFIESLLE